jgi:hypothetical protein
MSSLEVVLEGPRGRAELLDRYVEFVAARCRPNGSADRWTEARIDGATVTAFSWSCYRVTIDVATGAELARVFTK